jgi:predicted ATPase/DNA-binding winged helix-turn-helix (wHTH) protein
MPARGLRSVYASGECEVDLGRRELRVVGSPVPVGGRAFEILQILTESAGELVTKVSLMDRVWPGAVVNDNTLQMHIAALRKALGPHRAVLKTESGRGYRLLGTWTVRHQGPATAVAPQQLRVFERTRSTGLPAGATALIGRSTAVQRLRDLISAHRVVTLTGPGGIGKTALALEVASGLQSEFQDAAWLVELASLSDPGLVPTAVAGVLGLRLGAGEISAEAVAHAVGETNLLLIVDNCEHVIDAAANVVDAFVRMCPRAAILATSRETLRTNGEHVYRVPPLEVPAVGEEERDQILAHGAVELFTTRARALNSDLSLQAETLRAIGAICRHLDGIPLAIEFAAARAATLGVQEVAAGLRNRFAVFTIGQRTALPRHRTLRATFDWSYELLPEVERRLLRRLAVFSGGFALEAAVAVMDDVGFGAAAVTDGIANLVAKSLVLLGQSEIGNRWFLLETIRAYALEKLIKEGEVDTAARQHATYFRDYLVPIATNFGSGVPSIDVAAYAREIDNVRAALDWSFSTAGDVAIGVALTAAYVPVWLHSVLLVECCERCENALFRLEQQPKVNPRLRLQMQIGFGLAAARTMRPVDEITTVLASALDIAQSLNDLDAQLSAICGLWGQHYASGKTRAALSLLERLSALGSSIGDPSVLIIADWLIGNTLHMQGDQDRAQLYLERVIERSAASATWRSSFFPEVDQRVSVRAYLSRVLLLRGYLDQATEQARTSLEEAVATGSGLIVCQSLRLAVCHTALMIGDLVAAKRQIARLVDTATALNASPWVSYGRCFEGKLLIAQGAFEVGATLLRSELDVCERTGWTSWYPEFLGVYAEGLAGLRRFPEALASLDQALARADQGGEHYYVAELLRLKGEFLLAQLESEYTAAIDDCFHAALGIAREQGSLLFELRTALSLARLRVAQGRRDEACEILAPVYDRFTEGFGTADLLAAKELLDG